MKKVVVISMLVIFSFVIVSAAYAGAKGQCPQKRKTKSAPPHIAKLDKTGSANLENGKKLYIKNAKPQACVLCHGKKGDGTGKLGAILPIKPRNFACAKTMKKVSAGQMFWIIKNGSKIGNTPSPMVPFGAGIKSGKMKDKEIWDVIKYIRTSFVK